MSAPMVKFLLVDDLDSNLVALEALLRRDGLELLVAHSGPAALEILLEHEVDLALLDVNMPGMDGFQLAEFMRGTDRTRSIPIIFITAGSSHVQPNFRGYELGAVDFLFKPIDSHVLLSKGGVFFQLAQQRQELRRLAEERAKQSAAHAAAGQFLRTMMDGAYDLIYAQNPEGRVLFANAGAAKVWRLASEKTIGRKEVECWPLEPAAAKQLATLNADVTRTGLRQQGEIEALVDGQRSFFWVDKAPMRGEHGIVSGVVTVAKDITELRQAREALAAERALLEALLEASPIGLMMVDAAGCMARINPAAAALWGPLGRANQQTAYPWKGWWADDSARSGQPVDPVEWAALRALRGEPVQGDVIEVEPFDEPGSRRIIINAAAAVRSASGAIVGAVIAQTDITGMKRTERALRQSEDRVRQQLAEIEGIYDAAPLGMCTFDEDLRLVRINGRLAAMNGLPAAQHVGRTAAEVLPALANAAVKLAQAVLRTGLPIRHEVCRETPAQPGVQRVWDESWYPLKDSSGAVLEIGVMVDDITERRQIEHALRESEEQFRALAEHIPHLAWMCDPAGNVFWYNQRWLDFTGTTLDEVRDLGWLHYQHSEHKDRVLAEFQSALTSGTPFDDTFPLRGADGLYRWFLTRAFPLRNAQGSIVRWFGTNTDITVLSETQQALREARNTVQQYAQSLEATVEERTATLRAAVAELEAFSYSMAHDLRGPLRTMAGYAEVISQENPDLDATTRHYLDRIRAGARRLDRVTQEMLSYARLREALPLETVSVSDLLADLIESYPNLQASRDQITVDSPIPRVIGNAAALTQVLSNLVGNALKFVAPGCPPEVRVWGETVAELPDMPVSATGWVRVYIEDKGIGIPPEARGKLFQLFQRFTLPGNYEGVGMGLAMAHKAVERMHGRIGYEPLNPRGSRFWFALPAP